MSGDLCTLCMLLFIEGYLFVYFVFAVSLLRQTFSVAPTVLELRDLSASAFQLLGLKGTTPSRIFMSEELY